MIKHKLGFRIALAACALAGPLSAGAATQVLYEAGVTNNNPALAGWLAGGSSGATLSYSAQGVLVTPAAESNSAGYSNYSPLLALFPNAPLVNAAFPQLSSSAGYRLSFGMDMDSETHTGNVNRAGFSVTLIGHDLKGVEIGFQNHRIFTQELSGNSFAASENTSNPVFVAAAFASNRWDLTVTGNTYALTLGNQTVLSGNTRDYSTYTGDGQNAYRTRDFIFIGDNTSSAQATFTFGYAAITTPVPEPAESAMLLAGLACVVAAGRRRSRRV